MINKSILITDKVHSNLIKGLERDGYILAYRPKQSLQDTLEIIEDYEGIIINSKTICNKSFFQHAKNLRFIGRLGSGIEIIDLFEAKKRGISVLRTPEANCGAVAEHALGMILSLLNNFWKSSRELGSQIWNREINRGRELGNMNVGVIGFGHTGAAFAKLLEPFNCNVLCHDKYKTGFPYESSMEEIQCKADIISLHLPLNDETIHYLDNTFIEKCENPTYVINTARGQNINTKHLLKALDSRKILGACLDVFENEKPNTYSPEETIMYNDLMNRDNVICTPHIAGWSFESFERIADTMLEKIRSIN